MNILESDTTFTPSKGNILVVDDTPANLRVLMQLLSEQKYKVRVAPNGKLALDSINAEPPDLILLDILMPEIDGYQLCEQLKSDEKTREIPIIFISALSEVFDKVKGFQMGGVDYITKPFEPMEVLARVENQLKLQSLKLELQARNQKLQAEITARTKVENDLNQRNAELEILNQDLDAFNYRLAHDLCNAITSICSKCFLLQHKYKDQLDSKAEKYIESIEEYAQNMTETINGLLSISQARNSQITQTVVNLSDIAEKITKKLHKEKSKTRKVDFIIHPNLEVIGDHDLLKTVLENLLNNAWKYASKQELALIEFGFLSIKREDWEKTGFIPECLIKAKNLGEIDPDTENLIYFVRDNGVGFDMEKADKIFAPFERLHSKNEFTGSGIGLSTVHRIIQSHGGYIWFDSKVNHGTTFYFTLNVKLSE